MKSKVLSKVLIMQDNSTDCPGSRSEYHGKDPDGAMRFVVRYCPNAKESEGIDTSDASTIIAHELGHVVGQTLKLPGHRAFIEQGEAEEEGFPFSATFNALSATDKVAEEMEAWLIAEKISPGSSTTPTAMAALGGYIKAAI